MPSNGLMNNVYMLHCTYVLCIYIIHVSFKPNGDTQRKNRAI